MIFIAQRRLAYSMALQQWIHVDILSAKNIHGVFDVDVVFVEGLSHFVNLVVVRLVRNKQKIGVRQYCCQ